MKTKLKSAEAFAKTVRESHGWPEASISANDCCKYERSAWLDWDRAWTAAQKDQAAEIAALKKDAERYRLASEHLILSGGTTKFGWPIAPATRAEWDRYLDAAITQAVKV
jgi:hypothetical protein